MLCKYFALCFLTVFLCLFVRPSKMFPFHLTQPIFRSLALFSSIPRSLSAASVPSIFTRGRAILAPRRVKWSRRHKGRVSIPTGGSLKGTVLAFGDYGLRTKGAGVRITAKQLQTAEIAVRQKLKVIKGAKLHLRVFPDIPVGVKVSGLSSGCAFRRATSPNRAMKPVWVKAREGLSIGLAGKATFFPIPFIFNC